MPIEPALIVSFDRQLSELAVEPWRAALFSFLVMFARDWASRRAMLPSETRVLSGGSSRATGEVAPNRLKIHRERLRGAAPATVGSDTEADVGSKEGASTSSERRDIVEWAGEREGVVMMHRP